MDKKTYTARYIMAAMLASFVAATIGLTTVNVNASTSEDNDDDGPALTMEKSSSNPSGEKVKDIQSNENSENARVTIERSQDHNVRGEPSDEPAHTSTRTVERGDTITTIERQSAQQSAGAASTNINDIGLDITLVS